jgi:hypothetical protein
MKKPRVAWLIALALGVSALLLLVSRGHLLVRESTAQTPQADEQEMVQILRREGLRGAARVKGHYIADFDAHWDFGLFDVEGLTRNSAAVVVGIAGRSLGGRLTASDLAIVTDYEVVVQDTIKGDAVVGSTIVVSMPGGRVDFPDGTSAELRTPKFEHVRSGGSYTFFLTEVEKSPGKFTLTGGPQGLVELVGDGSVKSHGREDDPIAKQSKRKNRQTFLEDVRESTKKWPNKGKCCSD